MTLCITNPLWVTKTRLMLQYNGVVNSSQRQYKGMFDTLLKIYKYEGVRGLYKVMNYQYILNNHCNFPWLYCLNSE